jgi:hypothetical protein
VKLSKAIALLGLAAMTGIILRAFIMGNFSAEGDRLLAMPWGVVSLVDLYVGFTLFSGWIVYREQSWLARIIWVVLMMTLGNWTAALYVFLALQKSGGDWKRFWLGHKTA